MRISDWSSDVCSSDLTDGPVTIVTINRPHVRNAVDNETAAALTAAFRAFDADATARVAILTGAGGTFCSGADLKALASGQDYEPWAGHPDGPCHDVLSKPLIAAVDRKRTRLNSSH